VVHLTKNTVSKQLTPLLNYAMLEPGNISAKTSQPHQTVSMRQCQMLSRVHTCHKMAPLNGTIKLLHKIARLAWENDAIFYRSNFIAQYRTCSISEQ